MKTKGYLSDLPNKAVVITGEKAWWYEDKKSIAIHIRSEAGQVFSCRIPRKFLVDWIKRSEPIK